MASMTITQAELLEALAEAAKGSGPEDARTVVELAVDAGIPLARVRKALVVLKSSGRLQVHTVRREAIDGRLSTVAGYTILPAG